MPPKKRKAVVESESSYSSSSASEEEEYIPKPTSRSRGGAAPPKQSKPNPTKAQLKKAAEQAQSEVDNELPLLNKVYTQAEVDKLLRNPFQSQPPGADVIRVLITTDNHLGYAEDNDLRSEDSFRTFEECLRIGRDSHCDLFLFGGDLFHENKPSRSTLLRTTQLLKHYCTGTESPTIQIISDEHHHFSDHRSNITTDGSTPMNITIPAFCIHGNHDDPTGFPSISALDILHEAKLINYFGKHPNIDHLTISPVVIQKATTYLAMYGIGNIRDERMAAIFKSQRIKFRQFDPVSYHAKSVAEILHFNEQVVKREEYTTACLALLEDLRGSDMGDELEEGDERWGHQPKKITTKSKASKGSSKSPKSDDNLDDPTQPRPYRPTDAQLDAIFGPLPHYNQQFLQFNPDNVPLDTLSSHVLHLPIIHQNRCASCLSNPADKRAARAGKTTKVLTDSFAENPRSANSIDPAMFPTFSDLIVWGHEHCCFPEVLRINVTKANKKIEQDFRKQWAVQEEARRAEFQARSAKKASKKVTSKAPVRGQGARGKNQGVMGDEEGGDNDAENDQNGQKNRHNDEFNEEESERRLEEQLELLRHSKDIEVLQPGSTVITSLCDGESFSKHCFILEVRANIYRVRPIRLQTARPFVIQDMILTPEEDEWLAEPQEQFVPASARGGGGAAKKQQFDPSLARPRYTELIIRRVNAMLARVAPVIPRGLLPPLEISDRFIRENPHFDFESILSLPLVRLRITKTDFKDKFTLSTYFNNRVANPGDITLIIKPKPTRAEKLLLQQQLAQPRVAASARVTSLVSNVTAAMNKKKGNDGGEDGNGDGDGDNDGDSNHLVELAHNMNEIPDLLLLNVINDGNLSLVQHSALLQSLSSYVNNREANTVGKKGGMENTWGIVLDELKSDVEATVQHQTDLSFVIKYFKHVRNIGEITDSQYKEHIRNFMARFAELDDLVDDNRKQRLTDALAADIARLRQKSLAMISFVTEVVEPGQSDAKFLRAMVRRTAKMNERFNERTLNEKMRLMTRGDSDEEDDDDDDGDDDGGSDDSELDFALSPSESTGRDKNKKKDKMEDGSDSDDDIIVSKNQKDQNGQKNNKTDSDSKRAAKALDEKRQADAPTAQLEQTRRREERERLRLEQEEEKKRLEEERRKIQEEESAKMMTILNQQIMLEQQERQALMEQNRKYQGGLTVEDDDDNDEEAWWNKVADADADVVALDDADIVIVKSETPQAPQPPQPTPRPVISNSRKGPPPPPFRPAVPPAPPPPPKSLPSKSAPTTTQNTSKTQINPQQKQTLRPTMDDNDNDDDNDEDDSNDIDDDDDNGNDLKGKTPHSKSSNSNGSNIYDRTGCGDDPNLIEGNYSPTEKDELVALALAIPPHQSIPHSVTSSVQSRTSGPLQSTTNKSVGLKKPPAPPPPPLSGTANKVVSKPLQSGTTRVPATQTPRQVPIQLYDDDEFDFDSD